MFLAVLSQWLKITLGPFARFLPLFRPYIGVIAQILTASLLLTVFGILTSLYFRSVIDDVMYTRAITSLTVCSIDILFLTLFQAIVPAIRSHLVLYFSLKIDFNLIFSYFKHALALLLSFFDTRKTGHAFGITRTLQTFFTGLLDGWSGNIIFRAGSYLILKDRFTIGQFFFL
ncbi:MAG: ABC transporter transmembrane domain-containing protein [Treponema sp.]